MWLRFQLNNPDMILTEEHLDLLQAAAQTAITLILGNDAQTPIEIDRELEKGQRTPSGADLTIFLHSRMILTIEALARWSSDFQREIMKAVYRENSPLREVFAQRRVQIVVEAITMASQVLPLVRADD